MSAGFELEETKTQEWDLEGPILISFNREEECVIVCGGAEMPRYSITAPTLPDAIAELVRQVTADAIADEAREWRDVDTTDKVSRLLAQAEHNQCIRDGLVDLFRKEGWAEDCTLINQLTSMNFESAN